jgi:glutamine amidotransferase
MITILDYGMGNLRSVEKAFQKIGAKVKVSNSPKDVKDASSIVLPGVGAFKDCMENLERLGLTTPIIESIKQGKPYLGICLGMHILFEESSEFGIHKGLGIFKGNVPKFQSGNLKIPHMGWNKVNLLNNTPLFEGIEDGQYFYFVHSYYVAPKDEQIIAGTTQYGGTFTSMIHKDNIYAVQFHPEKSQKIGLKILENFVKINL